MGSRIIKFRAWDVRGNEMFEVSRVDFAINRILVFTKDNSYPLSECHIMQFTGLQDKNGKDIYEGDILHSVYSDGKPCRHVVEYDKERARFAARYLDYISYTGEIASGINQDWLIKQDKEVIGNIYSTPELLTQ